MKSSLPQIFRKDLKLLSLPEKQTSQFSLYLRTNSFKPNSKQTSSQNRYGTTSKRKLNKSVDTVFNQTNNSKFHMADSMRATKGDLKRLLSQNKTRSKSMFIQQKNLKEIQEVDSFKTIRKRVLEEMIVLEKSFGIVKNMQDALKTTMQEFKQKQIEGLECFQTQTLKKMALLLNTFKTLKKQTKTQVKVNKQQLNFIEQELGTYKQLVQGFEQKQAKFKFEIIQGGIPSINC